MNFANSFLQASEIKRNPFSDLRLWLLPADDGLSEAVADKTPLQHPRLVMRARKLSSQDSGTESLDSQYEYAQQTILQPRHEDSLEETQESSLGIDTRTPSAVVPTIAVNPVPITQAKAGTSSPHTGTLAHRNPGAPPTAPEMPAAASAPAVESVASASAAKAKATAVQSRSPAPLACNPPLATMRPVQTGYFQSSILLRYEHAAAAKILILVTKRGDAYRYSNVDASVVQGLQDAASAGTFWNKHLKKKYLETKVGTKSKPHAPLSGGDPDGHDSSTTGSSMLTTASKRPRTAICGSLGTKPVHCTAIGAASGPAAGTAVEESLGTKPDSPRAASMSPARNPEAIALPSQSVLASLPTLGSSRNAAATNGACPAVTSSLSGAELLTGRTFTFSGEDFDGEGVLYWLGTHGKTAGYQNPATCVQCRGGAAAAHCALPHCVRVTSTAISDGDSHLFVEHQFANQNWTVDDKTSTFFAVELPAPLSITHYTLRHGDKEDFAYSLRNWVLEGSADGKIWTTLSSHDEDASLRGNYQSHTWPLLNRAPPCRHFRVMVARKNEAGTFHLVICGFELYGTAAGDESFHYPRDEPYSRPMTHSVMGARTDAALDRASHPKAMASRSDVAVKVLDGACVDESYIDVSCSPQPSPESAEPAELVSVHIGRVAHRPSKRRRTAATPLASPQPRSAAVLVRTSAAVAPSPKLAPAVVKEPEQTLWPMPTDGGGGESIMFGDDSYHRSAEVDDSVSQGPADTAGGCTPDTLRGQLNQLDQQIEDHEQQFDRLDDTTNLEIEAAEDEMVQCEEALARAKERVRSKKQARQQALFDHNATSEALQTSRTRVQRMATLFEEEVGRRELTTLSVAEVCELLHLLGCPVPISLLRDEGVGGKELKLLREGDMQSVLGIERLGDRRRLSAAVKALAANMGFRRQGDGANGWSVDKVCDWLEEEELREYKDLFREQAIDGSVLLMLSPDDLRSHFQVRTIRETTQILEKIDELKRETLSAVPSPEFNLNAGLITPTPREKQVGPFGRGASAGDRQAAFDELIRTSDALRQFMVQVGSDSHPFQRGPAADRQYNCPITGEVMREPFVAGDGYTYEKVAIQAWLHRHKEPAVVNGTPTAYSTSPKTGAAMTTDLKPNMTLFDRMHSTSQSQMQF